MEGQFQSSKSGSGPVNWKQMLTGKITVAFKEANLIEVYINDVELECVQWKILPFGRSIKDKVTGIR